MSAYPQPVRVRFWARVDRTTTPEGCWPWTGALSVGGYGRFTVDGRTRGSHVWALVLGGVAVPEGAVVRHLCGNPACCRPEHLSAEGGQRENNLDSTGPRRSTVAGSGPCASVTPRTDPRSPTSQASTG